MKRTIIANWKMNPDTPREARRLFGKIKRAAARRSRVTTVVCPPTVFLPLLQAGKNLALGGQDIFTAPRGAYTGSISAAQIKFAGAAYVILGHSERRWPPAGTGETNEVINEKIKLALATGLRVILCVGETARDERGDYLKIVREMLERGLDRLTRADLKFLLIAYEPVWAITAPTSVKSWRGTADTPEDFLEQSLFIRKVLAARFGQAAALAVPVLYGGSATPDNAADFLTRGEAAGLLVGHASLRADQFNKILRLVDRSA